MKILIVTTVDADRTATFIKSQIKYFNVSHVLHTEFKPYRTNDKSIFAFPLNINIVRISVKKILPSFYTRAYNNSLKQYLRETEIDAVLCNYGTYGANIADACCEANVPLVIHFHGYDAFQHDIIDRYSEAYRNMFDKASYVIAVSEDMRKQLINLGAPVDKVVLRPYGVDTSLFAAAQPEKSEKVLLFVGRFTAKKDPVSLLKAFDLARKTVTDAKLVMIGKGELYDLVLKTVDQLNLRDSVEIFGWQSSENVARQMRRARAYVQHSVFAPDGDSEGSPVSVIEAAGSGLPIISTRHAGIKESVIEGVTGYLVDEGDWQGMGEYMIKLLNDPDLAGKMGRAGREHILQNYDINRQMTELREVLEKAVIFNRFQRIKNE